MNFFGFSPRFFFFFFFFLGGLAHVAPNGMSSEYRFATNESADSVSLGGDFIEPVR